MVRVQNRNGGSEETDYNACSLLLPVGSRRDVEIDRQGNPIQALLQDHCPQAGTGTGSQDAMGGQGLPPKRLGADIRADEDGAGELAIPEKELIAILTKMEDLIHRIKNILTVQVNERWLKKEGIES